MIRVGDLVASMRYRIGDMQGVRRSDFELIEALNAGVEILYRTLADRWCSSALRKAPVAVENGRAPLPSDFRAVRQLLDERGEKLRESPLLSKPTKDAYRLSGGFLEAPDGFYLLEYYRCPPRASGPDGMLDVERALYGDALAAASAVLVGDLEPAVAAAAAAARRESGRGSSGFSGPGAVQILGGKL
jgi:hypothetical protein